MGTASCITIPLGDIVRLPFSFVPCNSLHCSVDFDTHRARGPRKPLRIRCEAKQLDTCAERELEMGRRPCLWCKPRRVVCVGALCVPLNQSLAYRAYFLSSTTTLTIVQSSHPRSSRHTPPPRTSGPSPRSCARTARWRRRWRRIMIPSS